jgi:hypothetical protein
MANRTYPYEITWAWKEDGNKPDALAEVTEVSATTVQRAISKLVRELNEGQEDDEQLRASDIMIVDVRSHKLTNAIMEVKKRLADDDENAE